MTWNPDTYLTFAAAREAPFVDLMAMIERRPRMRVIDLGCGTGALTAKLSAALPKSDVRGIDHSPEMLARAEKYAHPGLRFSIGDIEEFEGAADLIFSHAALHWVPDHPRLFARLMEHLHPEGQLAVQVPSNYRHISHTTVMDVAQLPQFSEALEGYVFQSPVLSIDAYARLLHQLGGVRINVYEKVYPVVLEGVDDLLTWLSGTTLVPYMSRLTEAKQQAFRDELRRRYISAGLDHAQLFYPFRRTLLSCHKPQA